MKITLLPQLRSDRYTLERLGDALVIDGEVFDFAPLAEGETLPLEAIGSPWFGGAGVTRVAGEIEVALVLPHGWNASEAARFPEPIIDPPDGPITVPA